VLWHVPDGHTRGRCSVPASARILAERLSKWLAIQPERDRPGILPERTAKNPFQHRLAVYKVDYLRARAVDAMQTTRPAYVANWRDLLALAVLYITSTYFARYYRQALNLPSVHCFPTNFRPTFRIQLRWSAGANPARLRFCL